VGRMSIYAGGSVDSDDLISYGIFGLIDAINKFDHTKGAKFETYASLRIRGAILDGLRSLDWIPRNLRQKSKKLDEAYVSLESVLGREPTAEELAQKLKIGHDEVEEEIKKASLLSLISLDDYLEGASDARGTEPAADVAENPEKLYEKRELKEILISALKNLTEKERVLTMLYYFEQMTHKEISKIMNISESRVSQIHSKTMLKLRTRLGKYRAILFA